MAGYRSVERWLDPCRVRAYIQDSLGRLERDTIDLYYLHHDDTRFTVAEIIDMMNRFVTDGLIRFFAASNWTASRLAAANAYARHQGVQGFVASQVEWSLAEREPPPPLPYGAQTVFAQPEDQSFHERTGLPLCAYSATAGGFFSRVPTAQVPGNDRDTPASRKRLLRTRELASEYGKTPTQIALAWLMHQRFRCIPITGTTSVDHLRENLGAAAVLLTADQVRRLRDGQ